MVVLPGFGFEEGLFLCCSFLIRSRSISNFAWAVSRVTEESSALSSAFLADFLAILDSFRACFKLTFAARASS